MFPKQLRIVVTPQDYIDADNKRSDEDYCPVRHCAVAHAMNRVGREQGFEFDHARVGMVYGHFANENGIPLVTYGLSHRLMRLVSRFMRGTFPKESHVGIAKAC